MPKSQLRRTNLSKRKKILYSAIISCFCLMLAEVGSAMLIRMYYGGPLPQKERLHEYHAELGWINIKNHSVLHRYGENLHVAHNDQGFRGTINYTPKVPNSRYRVVFLGDSFTYGVEVGDSETFPALMEAACPTIQSVNMGVAGFGIDQIYLWYLIEGLKLDANLVVLAVIADDFQRMKASSFLARNPKPQLQLIDQKLVKVNVPVPTWGDAAQRGWFEEFPNRTAIAQLLRKVRDRFSNYQTYSVANQVFASISEHAKDRNSKFALVYLPSRSDLSVDESSEAAREMERIGHSHQIPFINLTASFKSIPREQGVSLFVENDSHYSHAGYKFVASLLLSELRVKFPELPR